MERAPIVIRYDRLWRQLQLIVSALIVASFIAQFMKWKGVGTGVARFFDSDQKANIPTGFKILALVSCTLVIWLIARAAAATRDGWAKQWRLLAVIVAFLTLDEIAFVHQSLGNFLRDHIKSSGALHFTWVLVYFPLGLLAVALLWRFFWSLARQTRAWFATSAAFLVLGAGVLNLAKGSAAADADSLSFLLLAATSDALEEASAAILLVAALRELATRSPEVQVSFEA